MKKTIYFTAISIIFFVLFGFWLFSPFHIQQVSSESGYGVLISVTPQLLILLAFMIIWLVMNRLLFAKLGKPTQIDQTTIEDERELQISYYANKYSRLFQEAGSLFVIGSCMLLSQLSENNMFFPDINYLSLVTLGILGVSIISNIIFLVIYSKKYQA